MSEGGSIERAKNSVIRMRGVGRVVRGESVLKGIDLEVVRGSVVHVVDQVAAAVLEENEVESEVSDDEDETYYDDDGQIITYTSL